MRAQISMLIQVLLFTVEDKNTKIDSEGHQICYYMVEPGNVYPCDKYQCKF